jgi:AcrR family transcriptional regulator
MSTEKISAREKIILVAGKLFYAEGYRAIGVDRVIAEAEVAKATFYKHFPSKDDLIVAWINKAEESSKKNFPAQDVAEPLFTYVDAMIDIAQKSWCLGCTYQGSAAEFADPGHPVHAAAIGVKNRVIEELEARAALQGLVESQAVAEKAFLLLEGIWASVRMFRDKAPLTHAKKAMRQLAVR